jgi:hypothetical protein
LKRNADEIALPPDHAAVTNGVKFVKTQFEIQRQQIEGMELDSGPGIRDVLNATSKDTALRVKEQQRVFRDRRPRYRSAFEFHSELPIVRAKPQQRLANCAQAAIRFGLFRKQSILMIVESPHFTGAGSRRQDRAVAG